VSEEEVTSSKERTSFEKYKDNVADRMTNKSAQLEAEEQCAEIKTTSVSEYKPKGSGSRDSGSGSESVDIKSEFSYECVGTENREGSSRGRWRSIVYLYIL